MNFSSGKFDFNAHANADLYHVSLEILPALKRLYPREVCRGEDRTSNYAATQTAVAGNGDIAQQIYDHLLTKYAAVTRVLSTNAVNHVYAHGGEVHPVQHVVGVCSIPEVQGKSAQEVSSLYEKDELEDIFSGCFENKTDTKGPGISMTFGNSALVTPVVLGDPVFTPTGISVLSDNKLEVTQVRAAEVRAGHMIVDAVRVTKGQVSPKTITGVLVDCYGPKMLAAVTTVSKEAMGKFTGHLKGSAKGRDLLDMVLRNMISQRDNPAYKAFLDKMYAIYMERRDVQSVPKIGNYDYGTLQYATIIRDQTRGIRGSDDRDSTSTGISCYLPVNVPRSTVKAMARVQDLALILKSCDPQPDSVYFTGSAADEYVNACWVFNIKLRYVGSSNPKRVGWVFQSGRYHSDGINFEMGTDILGLVINTDICEVDGVTSQSHVQMIHLPPDISSERIMPSVLMHNLTGYLLPVGCKYKDGAKLKPRYFKMSVAINLIRTFPSFYNGLRVCEYLRKSGVNSFSMPNYGRITRTMKEIGHTVLAGTGGFDQDLDFLDVLTADEKAAVVKNLDKAPVPVVEVISLDAGTAQAATEEKKEEDDSDPLDEF